ncbi:MAG: outer-membrane lipoprotein carrier protein LolA [Gemmatimonadaceae bacterium]|jgi:outer membrane lipoprotein carrier protein|nr:outer-membrane lipoprotein carrier protein LolA [Gemmatimonadaceae bacterium]
MLAPSLRPFAPRVARAMPAVVVALATASYAMAQSASSSAQLLDRARARFAATRTASAAFEQRIANPLTGRTLLSRGTFVQRKPSRLAVSFTEPAGDRIVADGTWLWLYLPSTNPGQVLKLPAGESGTGGVDVAAMILDAPRGAVTTSDAGSATIAGRATRAIGLVPKAGSELPYQKATVWLDTADASVRQVLIVDEQGVERTVTITRWSPNSPVADSAFRFVPPKGAKVVTDPLRGM